MVLCLQCTKIQEETDEQTKYSEACNMYCNESMYAVLHKHLYKVLCKHRWRTFENTVESCSENVYLSPCSPSNKNTGPSEYLID